jgi:hypothetical protein
LLQIADKSTRDYSLKEHMWSHVLFEHPSLSPTERQQLSTILFKRRREPGSSWNTSTLPTVTRRASSSSSSAVSVAQSSTDHTHAAPAVTQSTPSATAPQKRPAATITSSKARVNVQATPPTKKPAEPAPVAAQETRLRSEFETLYDEYTSLRSWLKDNEQEFMTLAQEAQDAPAGSAEQRRINERLEALYQGRQDEINKKRDKYMTIHNRLRAIKAELRS